ncbi:MAG: PAS domain S-box protein, partial [Chlorobi bacterium]|nr:PAS domain S-box protein [Chlorobiota bacterium]
FIHPSDLKRDSALVNNVLKTPGAAVFLTQRVADKWGNWHWFEGTLTNNLGVKDINAVVSIFKDVSEKKKSEIALKESEQRFRNVLESTTDVIYQMDIKNKKYLYASPACKEVLGVTVDYFLSAGFGFIEERIHKDDLPTVLNHVRQIFSEKGKGKKTFYLEYRLNFKDGNYKWLSDKYTIIYDSSGNPDTLVGNISNITYRKEAQEELRKSHDLQKGYLKLLTSIQNALPGQIAMLDSNGIIVSVNESWKKFSEPDTMINGLEVGFNFVKMCESMKGECTKDARKAAKGIKKVLKGEAGEFSLEYSCSSHLTERWFRILVTPINKKSNEGAVILHINVTERKLAELALKESEIQFRQLFEEDLTGNYIADINGKIHLCNPAFTKIVGFNNVKEVLNSRKFRIFSKNFKNTDFVNLLRHHKKIPVHEREIKRVDGKKITVTENILGKYDRSGRLMNIQGYLHDVTKTKEAEKSLKVSEAQYRLLFNENPLPMFVFDFDTMKFLAVNDAAIKFYGYSKSNFLSMTIKDIQPDEDIEKYMKYRNYVIEKNLRYKMRNAGVWKLKKKSGQIVYAEIIRNSIEFEGREAVLALANDVTEKFKTEEALKKVNKELTLLYEAEQELSKTLDLESVYSKAYYIVNEIMPCNSMIISSYSKSDNMIKCLAVWADGNKLDVSVFPLLPLAPKGYGLQSPVIHSGESKMVLDYRRAYKKSVNRFFYADGKVVNENKKLYSSALVVPMKIEGEVVGTIQVLSYKEKAFDADDLRILESLSSQISVATYNASLYQKSQNEVTERQKAEEALTKRTEELSVLYGAVTELSSTLDANIIYEKIYRIVSNNIACDGMSISFYDDSEKTIKPIAIWHKDVKVNTDNIPSIKLDTHGRGVQSKVILSGNSLLLNDYDKHLEKRKNKLFINEDGSVSSLQKADTEIAKSALIVPMKAEGKVIGVIQVLSLKEKVYNPDNLRMLESLSAQLSAATVNARLYLQSQNEILERIKKESELKEIRKNLEEAQRIAHLGSWSLDLRTKKIYNSEEVYRILGFEPLEREMDFDEAMSIVHHEDVEKTKKIITGGIREKKPFVNEDRIKRPDGEIRNVKVMGEPVFDNSGELIIMHGTIQDITDIKRINDELRKSLNEKEIMLKEIHHRVKNNLQVVSSLLRLQSDKIEDKTASEYLKISELRVKSMALIHQQLYKTRDLTRIDFKEYVKELSSYLLFINETNGRINVNIDVDNIYYGIDIALPCGLIVNELVTNSIKHAFPNGKKGSIDVKLFKDSASKNHLIIKDDGVGAKKLDFSNASTLGMQLVGTLTEQLEGEIQVNSGKGTEVRIIFDDSMYKSGVHNLN